MAGQTENFQKESKYKLQKRQLHLQDFTEKIGSIHKRLTLTNPISWTTEKIAFLRGIFSISSKFKNGK